MKKYIFLVVVFLSCSAVAEEYFIDKNVSFINWCGKDAVVYQNQGKLFWKKIFGKDTKVLLNNATPYTPSCTSDGQWIIANLFNEQDKLYTVARNIDSNKEIIISNGLYSIYAAPDNKDFLYAKEEPLEPEYSVKETELWFKASTIFSGQEFSTESVINIGEIKWQQDSAAFNKFYTNNKIDTFIIDKTSGKIKLNNTYNSKDFFPEDIKNNWDKLSSYRFDATLSNIFYTTKGDDSLCIWSYNIKNKTKTCVTTGTSVVDINTDATFLLYKKNDNVTYVIKLK